MAIFYTSYPNTQPSTSLTQYVVGDWWVNLSLRYAYKLTLNGAGFKSWVRTTTAPLPNISAIPTIVASTTTNSTTATIGQSVSFDAVTAYGGATVATSYTSAGTITGYNVTVSPALPSGLSVTKVLSVITGTDSNGNAALYNNIVVRITGTPTGTATLPTSYTVTLTDASGLSGSASFTLAVQSSGVTALTTTLAVPSSTFTQGNTVSVTPVTAAGGTTPLTFSISPSLSGSGLSLSSSNGAITGTANTILSTNYTITVTDSSSVPQSNSRPYSLTVNGIPLNSFVDTPTTVLTNKIAFTSFRPIRATGGFGTLTYAITPALPAGLTFNTSTGFITGTATESSPQTQYSVTVSDSSTPKQTTTPLTFNLTVNELQPVTAIVAQGTLSLTINSPVSTAPVQGGATIPIQGGGGFGTLTYSLSPALGVAGLTFDTTTGVISGTPTATKTLTTYTVTVTDQATTPQSANAQFSLSVAAATLATTIDISPLSLFKGVPTTLTSAVGYKPVSATDGTGTYSYALTGNTLPTGLSFSNSTGIITGTANTLMVSPGNTFTVTVTDQTTPTNQTSSKDFVLIVSNPPALVLTNNETGTRSITRGVTTSFTPATASGGYGTYTYSISPSLPASLVLNTNNGTISGIAANSNTSITTYTVSVTDQASQTQNTTFDLVINTPAYIKLSTTPTQNVTRDVPVISFAPLLVSGGDPGYTYSVSTGTLPAGLSLNSSTGYLSGTPTIVAANTFTITATDQASQNLTQNCTVTVAAPAALTTTLNQANTRTLVVNSTQTAFTPVTASGGYGTISFAIAPTLPSGLTFLSANGYIFGTASLLRANSSYRVTVSDTVSPPQTSFKDFFLEVVNAPLLATTNIANRSIVKNTIITPFIPVSASGGTPPYAYSASLPNGLTINTLTGAISGNTSITQTSTSTTINVSDVAGATTSNTFNLTITEPAALTANTSAANATFGVAYNRQIVIPSGGFGNYTYAFTNGTLTGTGLALNANTGFIAGTPTALKANSSYTIQVSDTSGQTANGTFNFSILPPALTSTVSSSSVTLQQYRSVTPFIPVKGNGGFGTLSYQITSGSLPAGLSFNTSTGQITGTPSATAAASLTVTITDEALTPQTTTGSFTLNVSTSAPAVLQAILGQSSYSFIVGENVNFTPVTGSGGYPGNSYQYAISGTLPAGLSFNTSTGNISGTFTEAFTSTSFTVTVNDEVPQYASKSFALESTVALVSAVDLLARNKSQLSFDQANASFVKANSAYGSQNTTGTYANSAYAQANAAFLVANTPNHISNSASLYANAAFIQANGAFLAANTPSHIANSGSSYANAAFIQANAAFAYANTLGGGNLDQFARDTANSAGSYANSAFNKANNALANTTGTFNGELSVTGIFKSLNSVGDEGGQIDLAKPATNTSITTGVSIDVYQNKLRIFETGGTNRGVYIDIPSASAGVATDLLNPSATPDTVAREAANSAGIYANGAFTQANTANTNAATADSKAVTSGSYANSAYAQANTATNSAAGASLYANGAFAQANAAYNLANTLSSGSTDSVARETANSASLYANGAFIQANTAINDAAGASLYANGAFVTANSAGSYANSAFNKANNALPSTGGTITGSLTVTQDVSITGNLVILGNTTSINTSSFTVQDTLLTLGIGNYTNDLLDIGFSSHYNDGTNAHTGIIRDASEKQWMFFEGYTGEVSPNNNIVITDPSFRYANVRARDFTGNLIANTVVVNGTNLVTYINNAYNQANTATNNAAGASLYANAAFIQANAAFAKANTGTANTAIVAETANVAINARITNVTTGIYYPIVTDTTVTGSDTFHYSSNDFLMYAANNTFRATGNVWAGQFIAVGNNIPVVNSTGHWVGQALVANNASTANVSNVAINARITVVNTGIYYPIVTDTTITGSDTFHYSSNDFLMYAANNTFRATGNVWAGENIVVGSGTPVVNSTGHWVGQALSATDSFARTQANAAFNKANTVNTSFISSGTSNVYFATANGNIIANVGGNIVATVTNTGIELSGAEGDISGANNIYANTFISNTSISVLGNGGTISGANLILANNIITNVGLTIASTNVLPYIQSSFDQANTDVTNITISSPGTYGNASYIPVITLTANGRINTISTIAAAGGGGGSGTDQFARDTANAAFIQANAAFNAANTGGGGGGGSGNTIINTFTGNGITNTFSLPTAPSSANNTIVNIDGVLQLHAAYNISGSNVVFSGTPANNAQIEVMTLSIGGGSSSYSSASANVTASINTKYIIDTSTANVFVTLPASPSFGNEVGIIDGTGNANTYPITVKGNGEKIQGDSSDMIVSTSRSAFTLVYYNAAQGWLLTDN